MSVVELDRPAGTPPTKPSALDSWVRALELTSRIGADPRRTFPSVIEELAERFGDAPALLSDRECFSFRGLAERSNQYSRWALDQGVSSGETVCLLMPNRPEYLAIWIGVTRVGGVVALLNTNLMGSSLAYCIAITGARHVIVAAELMDAFEGAAAHFAVAPRLWLHGPRAGRGTDTAAPRIDLAVEHHSGSSLPASERPPVTIADKALCIYTSGTTGLPKAANVSHHRVMMWTHWFAGLTGTGPSDRMYNCLPLYHSVGGIVATGSVLVGGGSVVIRERFSARRFWDEIFAWDCTLFQYIGELCRYLLKALPNQREVQHRLRLCCGNGLKGDVWDAFKDRFEIPQVLEFYASTEGSFSLYNVEGRPGAIGRIPSFLAHRFPVAIVKFDVEVNAPVRDAQGSCIRCARNEIGEAIGRISGAGSEGVGRFEGYTDEAETDRKVLRDVFAPGDAWFRTGDLMRIDEKGFFYFVDRVGDTFRWKGENVATSEVAEAIASCPGVVDVNVYGVTVPGADGRAGMVALVVDRTFDPAALRAHLIERLPDYARPLFLRIRNELELTDTFKLKKKELANAGFDPRRTADPLYFDDPMPGAYVVLDPALFARICGGELRL